MGPETQVSPVTGFSYREAQLHCEDVPVARIAGKLGTPLYLYSREAILTRFRALGEAFAAAEPTICYSVKANSNIHILRLLAAAGAGFDVVSGGELFRVLKAGADRSKIVFAGVGKTGDEIRYALEEDIFFLNVECEGELEAVAAIAGELGKRARVAFRFNPDVDAHTHADITTGKSENKFGLDAEAIRRMVRRFAGNPAVEFAGIHVHIGSQITDPAPHALALQRALALIEDLWNLRDFGPVQPEFGYVNIGGGFGISYDGGEVASARAFGEKIVPLVKAAGKKLILEPGRFIIGNAGILLTRVTYVKRTAAGKTFLICDAAMNDLVRPSLYDAHHHIWPVQAAASPLFGGAEPADVETVDVVGPICESGDFFARDRSLPAVQPGDLLAVFGAGAYGMTMSSNYNSRPRACEALVAGDGFEVIRRREGYEDLIRAEETTGK